jgi:hypothetical protein
VGLPDMSKWYVLPDMNTWQGWRRGTAVVLAGAAMAVGFAVISAPASAQVFAYDCINNRNGLVRAVEDPADCKFFETVRLAGGAGMKFVFVTSESYYGDITLGDNSPSQCPEGATGIDCARFECNRLADAVGLPGDYEPWLSTEADPAGPRFDDLDADGPWLNVKGDLVAASRQGLLTPKNGTDYLYNPILYTEEGSDPSNGGQLDVFVWTGTFETGAWSAHDCDKWSTPGESTTGTSGDARFVGLGWTFRFGSLICSVPGRLFCFQL